MIEELLKEFEEMKAEAEKYCQICKDAINREQYSYYYGRETAFAAVVNLIKGYIAATAIDMINNGEIIIGGDGDLEEEI